MIRRIRSVVAWSFIVCGGFCAAFAAAPAADAAYEQVRGCYRALQDAPRAAAAQFAQCAAQFESIARHFPDHPRAAEARYSIGLVERLRYQRTYDRGALKRALKAFRSVSTDYDTHRLADDALLQRAHLTAAGLDKPAAAQRLAHQVLRQHPDGDQRAAAQSLLGKLAQGGRYTLSPSPSAAPSAAAPSAPRAAAPATISGTTPTPSRAAPAPTAAATSASAIPAAPEAMAPAPLHGLRIAIDAGHGGHDPGAKGPSGVLEKQVTLEIARTLATQLRQRYGATVLMTRTTDAYVTLGERNRIANRGKADLFVSIHANAATHAGARGLQTYYLNNATDAAAKKLAARENAASGARQSELDAILSTMLQNAFTDDSAALAKHVQQHGVRRLRAAFDRIEDDRVHSALFYVLVGAKSPAILVETAFLSNPEEEQRLRDPAYQRALADGIATGIAAFWTNERRQNL